MIYFASDFHLGVPDFESSMQREKLICKWLDAIKNDATEVFFLGDVFDFWFEYKDVVPKGYVRLLGKIAELSDSGIKIFFFKGNHDMWTFGYLEQELGLTLVSDSMEMVRNGKKFYLHHGDGIGPGDRLYKLIKKVFRSQISVWLFGFLHPRLGVGLAKFLSRKSRISNGNNDKVFLGDDKEFIIKHCRNILQKEHYDFFICGHRHYPLVHALGNNSLYINLGEWVNDFTYAVFDGTHIELKSFEK